MLVLALGQHDGDYVDAYYGQEEWRTAAEQAAMPLEEIRSAGEELLEELDALVATDEEIGRRRFLATQTGALVARTRMLLGETFSFDEESRLLYDAVAPTNTDEHFAGVLERIATLLPGTGTISERYNNFRAQFVIPPALVDTVFQTAIQECRRRTREFITLPDGESFVVEYVTDKSWSGYNWYQGGYQSLIQVNIDFDIYIDRAIDLACHEGYPGHHTYNVLLEHELVERNGWVEHAIYPLFSPKSLIAEGSANYGIDMAFPGEERVRYETAVLFPLAGLDPGQAEQYYEIDALLGELSYAGNEAARRYLDGIVDGEEAAQWLVRYAMFAPNRAAQRVRFVDQYRSYVINYNLGRDLVGDWVEREAGGDAAARWDVFRQLLSSPRLPGDLIGGS